MKIKSILENILYCTKLSAELYLVSFYCYNYCLDVSNDYILSLLRDLLILYQSVITVLVINKE